MQTKNRIFDDMAKVASGAASTISGLKDEVNGMIHQRIEHVISEMDLVTREEFEVVKAMSSKARIEQDALIARISDLEAQLKKTKK